MIPTKHFDTSNFPLYGVKMHSCFSINHTPLVPMMAHTRARAHRTEGVTESERQEGSNGVGNRIGVGGGNGDGNGVGDGAGMEWEREREREWKRASERKMGTGTGTGTGRGRGWKTLDGHRMGTGTGAGTETRAIIVEMGMGTRIESERAEERRRSARNRTRLVDAIWETGETWLERGKNVEKKGLVHPVAANSNNLENNKEAGGGGTRYPGLN